jgi:hypothetical protein
MNEQISYPCGKLKLVANRRELLARAGGGMGMLALAGLLGDNNLLAREERGSPLAPKPPHFAPKAKAVIWLFMEGGPSGVDVFDPKPELDKNHGKKIDINVFFGNPGPLMKSPFKFAQYGECGAWVCEKYTHVARHVDEIAFIKSCYSESDNHVPALYHINTGIPRPGYPAAGSWITYGLGSENQSLPGYVVLGNTEGVKGGPLNWGNGFLPATYQGTLFRSQGNPVLNLQPPKDVAAAQQRAQLDLMAKLNEEHRRQHPEEADLAARIQSFELAYRMQTEATQVVDLRQESAQTRAMYGIDQPASRSFGTKCLMARRLVESGVRFVQVYSDGEWDAHSNLTKNHTDHCAATDTPIDALLTDLKQRGLGRMPVSQNGDGRDHNPNGFLTWMAGAGIKGGVSHGATDETGYKAVENRVSVHDLHATILHLLGMDHKRLTHPHNGRSFRLTDVAGEVIKPILA